LSGLFTKRRLFRLLSSVVYLANTYTFMIASGGQVGILLSYAVAPLSLYYFIRLVRDSYSHRGIHTAIQFGLILSLQILFEPRMFIITLVSFVLFALLHIVVHPLTKKSFIQFFKMLLLNLLISVGLVLFLHSFWILPVIASLATKSSFTSLSTITTADYFSFTRFENAFSLLHANWPENIFGKTYFMRFQFLLVPLTGFSSLLFLKRSKLNNNPLSTTVILFSGALIILGSFLAKGTNDPLGAVYQFLITYVPGFVAFRDASKFFLLVSIGYSLLLPASLLLIAEKSFIKKLKQALLYIVLFFIVAWFFLHIPAWKGEIEGTFKQRTVPSEYTELYSEITGDEGFYRTLWVPRISRFAPSTNQHPAVSLTSLISPYDTDSLPSFFEDTESEKYLQTLGIRYVILPSDPYGELFLDDREFSQDMFDQTKSVLDQTSYLTFVKSINNLSIYSVEDPWDKVMVGTNNIFNHVAYSPISPSEYSVNLSTEDGDYVLLFNEHYDPNWKLIDSHGNAVGSVETERGMNSFPVSKEMTGTYRIYYSLQDWVNRGHRISIATVAGLGIYWLLRLRRKHDYDRS